MWPPGRRRRNRCEAVAYWPGRACRFESGEVHIWPTNGGNAGKHYGAKRQRLENGNKPMATSVAVDGDFEGCARPSQPTIGIAAALFEHLGARSRVTATRRGNPPGRGEIYSG